MNASSGKNAAFTLVELLTCLAIIGILAAVLIPVIGSARASAQTTACASNMRQLGVTLINYAQEHKNQMPAVWYENTGGYLWYFSPSMDPYLGAQGVARHQLGMCPSWNGGARVGVAGSVVYPPGTYNSYTYCQPTPPTYGATNTATPNLLHYARPAQNLLLCESRPNSTATSYSAYDVLPVTRTAARFITQNGDASDPLTGFRHKGKMNAFFADGHMASLAPADITDVMVNP